MTEFELNQPASAFIETGRKAYRMGVHISGNPFKEEPFRDLWDKGYRIARRAEEGPRPINKRPPFKQQGDQGFDRKHRHPKPNERRQAKPEAKPQEPFNTDRLVVRFNRRNRTAT